MLDAAQFRHGSGERFITSLIEEFQTESLANGYFPWGLIVELQLSRLKGFYRVFTGFFFVAQEETSPLRAPQVASSGASADLVDKYDVHLSDLQLLVCRVKDNWKQAHLKGASLTDRLLFCLRAPSWPDQCFGPGSFSIGSTRKCFVYLVAK